MKKLLVLVLVMILVAGTASADGLGLTVGELVKRFNALPVPMDSPFEQIDLEKLLDRQNGRFLFFKVKDVDVSVQTDGTGSEGDQGVAAISAMCDTNKGSLAVAAATADLLLQCVVPDMTMTDRYMAIGGVLVNFGASDLQDGYETTYTINPELAFRYSVFAGSHIFSIQEK